MRPWFALTRPGNAAMGAVAALVGAVAAWGRFPHWDGVLLGALAAALGIAGSNALNDSLDWRIDRTAHPERPVARGVVSVEAARRFAWALLLAGVGAAAVANLWAGATALALLALVLAYEHLGKRRGLWGNLLVSLSTGGVFLLGAIAAAAPAGSFARVPLAFDALRAPLVMAGLAALLNLARELAKGAQDEPHDRGRRATFAVRHGAQASRRLGSALAVATLPLALLPALIGLFDRYYILALSPLALLVLAVPFVDAARSVRLLKASMVVGFLPFVATALI